MTVRQQLQKILTSKYIPEVKASLIITKAKPALNRNCNTNIMYSAASNKYFKEQYDIWEDIVLQTAYKYLSEHNPNAWYLNNL